MDDKKLQVSAPLPPYGYITDEHREWINSAFIKLVNMLETQANELTVARLALRGSGWGFGKSK